MLKPIYALTVCASIALAQDVAETIRVDVSRVVLFVTVREGKARFVGDLTKPDFIVKDDGVQQEVRDFSRNDVPSAIGLIVDNSQSMLNKRAQVIDAAQAFIAASRPDDEMFVVHFNDDVQFGLPKGVPFTSDRGLLNSAINRLDCNGKTALYDAIDAGIRHLETSRMTKKALVVISDGGDNASRRKIEDVLKTADLSGALFYAVGIYDEMDGDANPGVLRRLATATGGEANFPKSLSAMNEICLNIARDLRSQYTLTYSPPQGGTNAKYHKVQVSVKDPQKRKLFVRARTGYFSGSAAK